MLVKATQPVIDRVKTQIENLLNKECKRDYGKEPCEYIGEVSFGNDEQKIVELLFWGEHLPYRDTLPSDWFEVLDVGETFDLKHPQCPLDGGSIVYGGNWGNRCRSLNEKLASKAPAFVVKLSQSHLVPFSAANGGYHRNTSFVVKDFDIHPAIREKFDTVKAILCMVAKWEAIKIKVLAFLESTKSVNEAVKLWPELIAFLDPEDRQRLCKEGTTKKARESRIDEARKVLAEIDTQSIVADVVGLKLSAA